MPELPDIEVYRHSLVGRFVGKQVTGASVHSEKRVPPAHELNSEVVGATLTGIVRDGKKMRFVFDNGTVLVVHLMLNGEFYTGPELDQLPRRRLSLQFDDQFLAIADFTGLTVIELNTPPSPVIDALDPALTVDALKKALSRRSTKIIKEALIDQAVIQGIGNKYSDEILYEAKISPFTVTKNLPDDAVQRLYDAMQTVLPAAVERLIKLHPDKMNGKMREGLKVHRQEKTPNGNAVSLMEFSGRKAYYSDADQKLYE